MKRLRRWLFNFAAVVLVLFLFLTIGLWIYSYWQTVTCSWRRTATLTYFISSHQGRFELARQNEPFRKPSTVPRLGFVEVDGDSPPPIILGGHTINASSFNANFDPHLLTPKWMGFGHEETAILTTSSSPAFEFDVIIIPHWFVATVSLILAAPLPILIRRLHHVEGICRVCGYDLRATPERCPECGMVPESKAMPEDIAK